MKEKPKVNIRTAVYRERAEATVRQLRGLKNSINKVLSNRGMKERV